MGRVKTGRLCRAGLLLLFLMILLAAGHAAADEHHTFVLKCGGGGFVGRSASGVQSAVIPVPETAVDGKKKKGKLPKVKKQKAPVTSADEPNWFFLTLSCLTLICVCFIAYLLFAQYMNMYEEMQIPIPAFLMPK